MTRPTIFTEITAATISGYAAAGSSPSAAPGSGPRVLGVDPGAVGNTITVGVEGEGAGVVVVGLQDPILELVLHAVGLVGGLDVHEGHRGLVTLFILRVTQQFHALHSTKPFEVFFDLLLPYVFREVSYPKVPSLADHY